MAKKDLYFRAGYQNAQNMGRSIIETDHETLNARANALAVEIVDRANQLLGVAA